ncbi:MAG: endonuclease III [Candidatus Babeliales bacterium]
MQNKKKRLIEIIHMLHRATKGMTEPAVTQIINKYGQDPFLVFISCLLSLRTKDTVSLPASYRLFSVAQTPQELLQISVNHLEKIIYPVAFYRKRAEQLHIVCKDLIERFDGKVPSDEKDLLFFKGVGRKTMNLVRGEGFGIPAICVDTHVHRISNRLGLVTTKTPHETEIALQELLPKKYWIEYNRLLVMWGQNICVPISPFCSRCAIANLCEKVNVKKSR